MLKISAFTLSCFLMTLKVYPLHMQLNQTSFYFYNGHMESFKVTTLFITNVLLCQMTIYCVTCLGNCLYGILSAKFLQETWEAVAMQQLLPTTGKYGLHTQLLVLAPACPSGCHHLGSNSADGSFSFFFQIN